MTTLWECTHVRVTFTIKPNAGTGPARFELRVTTEDGRTFAVVPVETSIA